MAITILQPGQPTPLDTQPGDFLLVHNTTLLARLIQFGQRIRHKADAARWSHVACLDGATLVEALSDGIHRHAASSYDDRLRALVRVDVGQYEATKRTIAQAYLAKVEGQEYGFLDFASVTLAALFGTDLILTTGHAMICSQLAAEVLERMGLFVPSPPELVTPAALWEWAR